MKHSPEIQNLADSLKNARLIFKDGTSAKTTKNGKSSVHIDVRMNKSDISKIAVKVQGSTACRASANILNEFAAGQKYSYLCSARALLWVLLNQGKPVWDASPFERLNLLAEFKNEPEYHEDILLPFDAVIEAIQNSGKLEKTPYGQVHVWFGTFASEARYKNFIAEHYEDDNDDLPLNEFAASQGKTSYDHDWIESQFFEDRKWESNFYYAGSPLQSADIAEIIAKAKEHPRGNFNAFFSYIEPHCSSDHLEFSNPRSFNSKNVDLYFAGSYDPNAGFQFW